jgi:hypothetical protein
MFLNNVRKCLAIAIILITFTKTIAPVIVYSDDVINPTPTPENTETQSTQAPVPTESVAPSPAEIQAETLTEVQSEISPTPLPDSNIGINNSANINNNESSTVTVDENVVIVATDEAALAQQDLGENTPNVDLVVSDTDSIASADINPAATIHTGDAISITNVENAVNTTNINSEIINQTINLFVDKNGDLDLSNPSFIISNIASSRPEDAVINVSIVNVNNYSYLSNDIVSSVDTGKNIVEGQKYALIETGDAYSLVSVLNQVNMTVVNSKIHLITVNIFGDLMGNIILPDLPTPENCDNCDINIDINNNANLENNIDSAVITGQNIINASESAQITTGEAKSSVSNINVVNESLIGANIQNVYINNMGTWNGDFAGWENYDAGIAGESKSLCATCAAGLISIENDAEITNNISSTANTGGNYVKSQNAAIKTGRAISAVSLFNFVNTTIINSFGFFGFINIFGSWTGNVGPKSSFTVENPPNQNGDDVRIIDQNQTETSNDQSSQSQKKAEGGLLSVSQYNNVGEYVFPGDTVTFFIQARNIGEGMVYGATLDLLLIKNGQNVGGAIFKLGNIDIKKKILITTGLVLSKDAQAGSYVARAIVHGTVGEENKEVSANADSSFSVWGKESQTLSSATEGKNGPNNVEEVLGTEYASINSSSDKQSNFLLYVLMLDLFLYYELRVIRSRRNLPLIFSKELNLTTRLKTIKAFLA